MTSGLSGEPAPEAGRSLFITAQDGLHLHVREYGGRLAPGIPVVCLPGLSRTVADFEVLAPALADDPRRGRRVIALDSRGRGRSEYDRNPENYSIEVELADLVSVLIALSIGPAVFIGSSRGGILAMLLAAAHPTALAGAVLHDIGPVIEPKGLMRIKSYVGKLPQPRSFEEGAEILRRLFNAQFPKVTTEQWLVSARRAWQMKNGQLVPDYDPRLARTLAGIDIGRPLPPLWDQFGALKSVPVLVIRGANSDILSAATVAEMQARHPGLQSIEVADEGHTPSLDTEDMVRHIRDFVARCEPREDRADTRSAALSGGR